MTKMSIACSPLVDIKIYEEMTHHFQVKSLSFFVWKFKGHCSRYVTGHNWCPR